MKKRKNQRNKTNQKRNPHQAGKANLLLALHERVKRIQVKLF
jgi:hypothetical protein